MRSRYVSPAHQAQEGRQGAPLLEHRGESPDRRRPGGAAAAAVPGRDQRFAGTGLAQVNRHPGGRGSAAAHAVAVSGGPLRGIAAGRLDRSVAAKRTAGVPAAPQGHVVGPGAVAAGDLPAAGAGQRVAVASRMVRAQCHGRSARRRPRAGRNPQAVSLSRPAARTQAGLVRSPGRTLARPVQHQLRCAALRSDQHLFQGRSAVCRKRQATPRLFARSSAGLRAGRHRLGGDPGGVAAGLRGAAWQHRGQHHLARLPGTDRAAVRQGEAHLVDGPRHPDRGRADRDAGVRSPGPIPRRHAQGPPDPIGEGPPREALAAGPAGGPGQALAARRRTLCFRRQRQPRRQEPAPAKAGERAMRRRQLKWLWARLKQLSMMALSREELLMKLGAARAHAPAAWRLVVIAVAPAGVTFTYHLDRNRLRRARRREGRYLLRTNLTEDDPAKLWNLYLLLVRVEEAFKNLKGDLAIRPIFHQDQARIEAHIFIAFLAYCLHATLARRLHALAPGLSPRSVIEKFAAMQMIDVHVPTTDGRELLLTRYTEPDAELRLLLDKLKLALPAQSPPKITTAQTAPQPPP